MPVVTTTFNTTLSDVWASPTWSASDPSKKVHDQLSAWVNAINDPTKIELIHSPGDATARGSSDVVQWLLRAREAETSSDYGIRFMPRAAGAADTSNITGTYYDRTAGAAFNGAGSMSLFGNTGLQMPTLSSVVLNTYVAYRADGDLPWFLYAHRFVSGATSYGQIHFLMRLSTSDIAAGSFYPASGLAKWAYAVIPEASFSTGTIPNIYTPQSSVSAPYRGVTNQTTYLRYPAPASTFGDGYFFRLGAQYGVTHFLGAPNYDDFLISNSSTGAWGDTVVINSVTYTRVGPIGLWVRSS
jgi:hypothetical protein